MASTASSTARLEFSPRVGRTAALLPQINIDIQSAQCESCDKWRFVTKETACLISGEDVTFECSDLLDLTCAQPENEFDILRSLCPRKRREILIEIEKAGLEIFDLLDKDEPILDMRDLALFTVRAPEGSEVESMLEKLRERIRTINPEMEEYTEEVKCIIRLRLEAFFNFCSFPLPSACEEYTLNLLPGKESSNVLPQKRACESKEEEPKVVVNVTSKGAREEDAEMDTEMNEWREKRREELVKRKRIRDECSGKYRVLQCERELQDFRGFSHGLCLLHDREDMEDPLHVALATLASRHPDALISCMHQSTLSIEEFRQEPKPCLIKFVEGEMECQASAKGILEMFDRAVLHHTFSLALVKEIEVFAGFLPTLAPEYSAQMSRETTPYGAEDI